MHMYPSADRMLFHSAELFWKSLIVLSDKIFDWTHEPDSSEFSKISDDILSSSERARLFGLIAGLPEMRRNLATYGYTEKGRKTAINPNKILQPHDVFQDLKTVTDLVETLKRIHLFQMSEIPIKVGVLSGYVNDPKKETPCESYPHSGFRKASQWVDQLKMLSSGGARLFDPQLVPVSDLGTGFYPVVINPFGECFPEKGHGRGVALATILEYIRDGGIFVNSAGHPFIYAWDVDAKSENLFQPVSYVAVTRKAVELDEEGKERMVEASGALFPGDSLILTTEFKVSCAWDKPGQVGPQETELTYDKRLNQSLPTKARVFRPIAADKDSRVIALASATTKTWGLVYPIAAIPHGRGFLVSCGMNLDGEKECNIVLELVRMLATKGLDSLISVA